MISLTRAFRRVLRASRTPAVDPRGTAAAALLAEYAELVDQARAIDRERRRLRKAVDQVPLGVHAGWRKGLGEPALVVDADAVRELLAEHGLAVPMKTAAPRLEVTFVGTSTEGGATDGGR